MKRVDVMDKLKKYIDQIRGVSYKPDNIHNSLNENSVILLRANNIENNKINLDDVIYVDKSQVKDNQYLRKGDILVCASSGSRNLVGKAALVNEDIVATFGAFCKVVRPKSGIPKYWGYYFASDYYRTRISNVSLGANINNIRNEHIDNLEINYQSEKIQEKIVRDLSVLDEILSMKEEQISCLENMVKSRFVEMFGDPVTNPMGWETGTLADVIRTKASNGFFAKRNAYNPDGNVAVLGVVDVVNRMYSKINDLPRTDATEKDIKKFRVGYGDILFCRSSLVQAGIGKASIVPRGISDDILFECHVIRLQLDMNKCLPEFVQILVSTEYCRNQLIAVSKTATMTTIGQDGVLATKIYIPPLDLQNKFLEVVELADKSKLSIQQSIETLQTLKAKLMQDYFG